ncbi:MAG TPA: glucoamylase family protein [Aquabacterium sp.]|uniref:GH36-type glycosyl hydrolase domain-containing protein n=1 Tax=Aquabacterium sp. TaxID=1872578 RepID=UPI002E2F6185|nr:glucoamylase family protein [Aquabacterium sp.]HEX5357154.1 glucoamylase family protein [Aquabacterium sp.]
MTPSALRQLIPQAPEVLCHVLDGKRGPVEPPIRSEIFGPVRFAQHGRSLGQTHRAALASSRAANFFPRLHDNIQTLREAQRYIGEQAATGYDISPAAEWLLDNFHLIEAQLKEVHEGLPRSYFRSLPMLVDAPLAGLPRVYGVAWAFVAHTDGAFDEDLLTQFLLAYQETRELNLSEMWALPTTLRVVLIENLRRLAERVATSKAAREAANLCCDRIETYTLHALDELLTLIRMRGAGQVFLVQMAQRLQDRRSPADGAHHARYHAWLRNALPDLAAAQAQQNADQAADNLSVSNAVTSLRSITDAEWTDIVSQTSAMMQLMLSSPVFKAEHAQTRDQTLHAIEQLARRSGRSEVAVAHTLLGLMHPDIPGAASTSVASHWLMGEGRRTLVQALGMHERMAVWWYAARSRLALPAYLGAMVTGTIGLALYLWVRMPAAHTGAPPPEWLTWLGIALMAVPSSETVVAILNRLISESARPRHLPRLAMPAGIPAAHRVMVVIPALLTDEASVKALVHRLHLHFLANAESQAQFALLTDWGDADTVHCATDQALLDLAVQGVAALNARHPRPLSEQPETGDAARFIVLHRERLFSPSEQRWIGWERKRGKLALLISALAEGTNAAFLNLGESSRMASDVRYIVTLDSDTQLPPGKLRELVGIAAHPHNQPVLDSTGQQVVKGYAILQPRTVPPLPSQWNITLYHWLFAGQCGIDTYSTTSSEVYQDLFGEGSFNGKGLLNVQAMHAVLSDRLPEGQVLSHDLLEGAMARCASVTDITLIEESPFHADVAASRLHRWTRGDWQLLPFLLQPWRYHLRPINIWKMCDNLRRSMLAPASLGLLVLSLCGFIVSPWAALLLITLAVSAGPMMGALAGLSPSRYDLAVPHFLHRAWIDVLRVLLGGAWHLVQLPQHALMAADAIARALFRMTISHRHLLQWTTSAAAASGARIRCRDVLAQHRREPVVALLLFTGLALFFPAHLPLAGALCLMWACAPLTTWWVSRPRPQRSEAALSGEEAAYLEGIARDTWRYFERCVGHADNHLPPDNLQTAPHDEIAHRTSPTNIGLYLLSVACARRFGWIGTEDLIARLESTLRTMHALARHHGHFLNWYDTQTLAPLLPMYLSTVDSGNLCGHLLAVAQSCRELADAPYDKAASQQAVKASTARLAPFLAARAQLSQRMRDELTWLLADHRNTTRSAGKDTQARLTENAKTSERPPSRTRLLALADAFEQLALEADFKLLYHPRRHLFHLGLRVAEQQLDAGFYDLLASEASLTGLLAIAKGDAPVSHWSALGRPYYALGTDIGLRSWSGSMFEYLMPGLVMDQPYGSVLRSACHTALQEQMAFTSRQGIPWGISESAHAGRDHTLAYQYAPHGVPRLALRRTPPDELVIAPYATALAAQLMPRCATMNFKALQELGARARYGFIEALDYSPGQQADGGTCTLVHTFMAHHQGMTIVSLANVLLDGVAQRWGMAHVQMEAVSSLLHERMPREISNLYAPRNGPATQVLQERQPGMLRSITPGERAIEPTQLLSNGDYHVSLRANGAGTSRLGVVDITRSRDDALRDAYGNFLFLRRASDSAPVSLTQHPAPDPQAQYHCTFHADRVCFEASWSQWQVHTTVWVSPEDNIEFRQVELRSHSDGVLDIELMSMFEVALSAARADEAHPAFANLFVQARWHVDQQALFFKRRPRLPTEQTLVAAHFLAESDPQVLSVNTLTDRQAWSGRNRHVSQAAAAFEPLQPHQQGENTRTCDTGLDPICALSVRLRLPPHGKAVLTFATAASESNATLHAVIDKYRQHSHVKRASMMSATLTSIRLRALRVTPENFAAIQSLSTALLLNLTRPHLRTPQAGAQAPGAQDRSLLWRLGIAGDRPIILVSAGVMQGQSLLRALAQGLRIWSWAGVACDLVIVNGEANSYFMPLHHELTAQRDRYLNEMGTAPATSSQPRNGYHVLHADELSADERQTLESLARLRLQADGRPLQHHVLEWTTEHEQAQADRTDVAITTIPVTTGTPLRVTPSTGHFAGSSGEFEFDVSMRLRPTRPWINVIANPDFGTHVSEAGGGYTWARNSRSMQITPWANDPVGDPPSESWLLQDCATMEARSLSPSAWGAPAAYRVTHGQGYSRIQHEHDGLAIDVVWCVDETASVKQVHITLVNQGREARALRLIGLVEWQMGAGRADRSSVHTSPHRQMNAGEKLTALMATQQERQTGFGQGTAFLALLTPEGEADDWTCDRRECFDTSGRLVLPAYFGRRSGKGLDPCAALSSHFTLAPGATVSRTFLIGYASSLHEAVQLANTATASSARSRLLQSQARWNTLLNATTVKTPDPLFDVMVNRWLLYQTVSCRLWAKSGLYQAGGATGFRDQLQDAMALSWAAPDRLRNQITLCASRQFVEGDVQHWWHAPGGAGVRTHFSDDLLWLPYACAHYLRTTGDASLLSEDVPFLNGAAIPEGAEDAYYTPGISTQRASVYEHAARAIDHSLALGQHGLPLMGTGDWNDGMNRVGHEGKGESVWLGWLLCSVVSDFIPLAQARGDTERARRWASSAQGWKGALNDTAWDGRWFKRAYFDDGQALGSHLNEEARIDLIAQAWAVLSGAALPELQYVAMASVDTHLVDHEAGLIKLLAPPLVHARPSAGYIQAYPPGVRENGGQYSHAGVWALMALAELIRQHPQLDTTGELADKVYRYFTYLSPAHRAAHPTHGPAYGIEPYVMAGDVYSQPPYTGRGGWSWYTGSASWLHRAAIEAIFGLQIKANTLSFMPCLPPHWQTAELTLQREGRALHFILSRAPASVHGEHLQLQAGEALDWRAAPAHAVYVVPLPMSPH